MTVEQLYLDFFNNFLTVERFAEFHGFSVDTAQAIINEGRAINHLRSKTCLK